MHQTGALAAPGPTVLLDAAYAPSARPTTQIPQQSTPQLVVRATSKPHISSDACLCDTVKTPVCKVSPDHRSRLIRALTHASGALPPHSGREMQNFDA